MFLKMWMLYSSNNDNDYTNKPLKMFSRHSENFYVALAILIMIYENIH